MRVFVGQIYIQSGVNYPFSHEFQKWIGEELTKFIKPSDSFLEKYSEEFDLIFRLSAKSEISAIEVKGPTVFKKDKDIEFTIFLPFGRDQLKVMEDYKLPLLRFIDGVSVALKTLAIDTALINSKSLELVNAIVSNEKMFKT